MQTIRALLSPFLVSSRWTCWIIDVGFVSGAMHESLCIGVCIEVCRECGRRQGVTDHISEAGMYKSTYASESDTYMLGKTAH